MHQTNISYHVPFTAKSSLACGFHVSAALGDGAPHAFLVDTGSVGILVPRNTLGPDYQDFDPSQDIEFRYVSSGNAYRGQWVEVPVVLGVPATWDGTGITRSPGSRFSRSTNRRISMAAYSASALGSTGGPTVGRAGTHFFILPTRARS